MLLPSMLRSGETVDPESSAMVGSRSIDAVSVSLPLKSHGPLSEV